MHKWGKDLQILFEIPSLSPRNEEIHKSKIQYNFPPFNFLLNILVRKTKEQESLKNSVILYIYPILCILTLSIYKKVTPFDIQFTCFFRMYYQIYCLIPQVEILGSVY